MGMFHKYARRLVVWLQTPSEEEMENRHEVQKMHARRALSRNVLNALRREMFYPEWCGLSDAQRRDLIEDVRAIGTREGIDTKRIDALVLEIDRPSARLAA